MADGGLIGSLDVTPPTGQTFAHIKVWTDLWGEYGAFVEGAETNAKGWWDAAALFRGYVDALDAVAADFQKILNEMSAKFTGAAAEAMVARGNEIVKHVTTVANQVRGYPTVVDNTGHDIKVYSVSFWEAHSYFHRMTEMEEDKIETRIREITQDSGMSGDDINKLVDDGRKAAYQMVEQNYMIPHQRKLLMILAGKYAGKHAALMPIDVRMDELATVSDGSGNDSGSGNGSGNKSGNGSGNDTDDSDSGSGNRSGSGSGSDGDLNSDKLTGSGDGGPSANDLGAGGTGSGSGGPTGSGSGSSGGGGSPSGKSAADAAKGANDAIDAMKGAGTGGMGSPESGGAGSGSPDSGGAGSGSPGSGSSGSGSPGSGKSGGSGSDDGRSKGLQDAEDAANKAIGDLMGAGSGTGSGSGSGGKKPPTSSAGPDAQERDQALQDAKDAANKAIDDLQGGSGSGSGIPTTSDPDARERVDALEDAREAVDDAIQDLIDKNEASDADPHDKEVRRDALRDAQDAADAAIEDLVKDQGGDSSNASRQDALDDVDAAVEDALGDLDDQGSKVRQDALDDARTAADDIIDELRDDAPDRGLTTEQQIHDDALGDAKRDLTSKFDRLINETLDDKALSDGDKLARVDALNDAKHAALGAVDDVVKSSASGGQSELARFLGPAPSSGGSSQAGGGGGGDANPPSGQGVHLATPTGGGQGGDTGSGAPMRLDAAQGSPNQGMPMAPPMGGMGAGGQQQRERDRASWLEGETDVWVDDEELSGRAIGRQPSS